MNKLLVTALFFSLICISCSDDDDDCGEKTSVLNIDATIHRAVISKQSFVEQDRIGVYIVAYNNGTPGILGDEDQTTHANVEYRYNNSGFWYSGDGTDIFLSENPSDLYAYHPYDAQIGIDPAKSNLAAYPFNIELEQHTMSGHSDFLWAKIPALTGTNFTAPIIFHHLMCRIEINIRLADGVEVSNTPVLKVYNTLTSCTINLGTGLVTPGTETNVVTAALNTATVEGFDYTYDAIIIPQNLASGTHLFIITLDDERFVYRLQEDISLVPQECYKFNLEAGASASANNRLSIRRIPEFL